MRTPESAAVPLDPVRGQRGKQLQEGSLVNLRGTPHLPRAQLLSHSPQSRLLHRSRSGQSASASSPGPPALPRTALALLASVSMVTVHKPPFAAGRAVSLQIRGAAKRCEVSWSRCWVRGLRARLKTSVTSARHSEPGGEQTAFPLWPGCREQEEGRGGATLLHSPPLSLRRSRQPRTRSSVEA